MWPPEYAAHSLRRVARNRQASPGPGEGEVLDRLQGISRSAFYLCAMPMTARFASAMRAGGGYGSRSIGRGHREFAGIVFARRAGPAGFYFFWRDGGAGSGGWRAKRRLAFARASNLREFECVSGGQRQFE